ncbi:MAG TPA: 4-hydroxy-tetrahydrodipicolinate reductase [Ruminococcaceae bacterium]|nr:4-hydroxy-tetrahydrodipicolinate reductase [Oscillospiraceae bacterium]
MINILLSGCNGTMGKVISARVAEREDCCITAGLDINTQANEYPVFGNADDIDREVDVIIDFSHPSALNGVLRYALQKKKPIVVATTGLSEEQVHSLQLAASQIPVFFSANMSLGINLLSELCKKAAEVLGNDFDIEIIEAHHNKKIDAPSGTALLLANSVSEGLEYQPVYEYNRHAKREKRTKNEIGIHAIRGGTIVGEHEVMFAGNDEIISIKHSARSKSVFATGAINAALFLEEQKPGLYSMKDMI